MKQHLMPWLYAAAGLLALPAVALAQSQAYTNSSVNVRAGPARDYPVVTQLPGGVPVTVMGCISGYQWCDVAAPNLRGWVYAGRLSYPYRGSNVPVMSYGTVIGLPIVTFSIGTYWGNYYRGRPWYNQRSRWANHPPPPPPRPGAGRPPGGRPPGGPPPGNVGAVRHPGMLAVARQVIGRRATRVAVHRAMQVAVRRVGSHRVMREAARRVVSHRVMQVAVRRVVSRRGMREAVHRVVSRRVTQVAVRQEVVHRVASKAAGIIAQAGRRRAAEAGPQEVETAEASGAGLSGPHVLLSTPRSETPS